MMIPKMHVLVVAIGLGCLVGCVDTGMKDVAKEMRSFGENADLAGFKKILDDVRADTRRICDLENKEALGALTEENKKLSAALRAIDPRKLSEIAGPERFVTNLVGGTEGKLADDIQIPSTGRWESITVVHTNKIISITCRYYDAAGKLVERRIGGVGGGTVDTIPIPSDKDITAISGVYGRYLDGIAFHFSDGTSTRQFGAARGDHNYTLPAAGGGVIVGFRGREGAGIDALGVVVERR